MNITMSNKILFQFKRFFTNTRTEIKIVPITIAVVHRNSFIHVLGTYVQVHLVQSALTLPHYVQVQSAYTLPHYVQVRSAYTLHHYVQVRSAYTLPHYVQVRSAYTLPHYAQVRSAYTLHHYVQVLETRTLILLNCHSNEETTTLYLVAASVTGTKGW